MKYPTQERLRELFNYDVGGFLVNKSTWKRAGTVHVNKKLSSSYVIRFDNSKYSGNRLIWIYFHGDIPDGMYVTRKDASDWFKIENLRLEKEVLNKKGRIRFNSKFKYLGVQKNAGSNSYKCRRDGLYYITEEDAAIAYDNAVEDEEGRRPNETTRKDVSGKVISLAVASQRSRALAARGNGRYNGVKEKRAGKFQAICGCDYIGTFDTKEQAARAYNIAAREKYGDHAVLNDIPDPLGEGAPI